MFGRKHRGGDVAPPEHGSDNPQNVPIPDPTTLTTDALNAAIENLQHLMEAKLDGVAREFATFQAGHEEKHHSVVDAAIRHRKELSEASMAVVQASMDARFAAIAQRLDLNRADSDARLAVSDARNQQRLDAQTAILATVGLLSDQVQRLTETVNGLDRVTDAKFVTFRTLIDSQAEKVALALTASTSAVDHAFNSSAAAVGKSEKFNEQRFSTIGQRIDELTSYRDAALGKHAGISSGWGILLGAVGLLAAVMAIIGTR